MERRARKSEQIETETMYGVLTFSSDSSPILYEESVSSKSSFGGKIVIRN
jgi:hypothetical protein